MSSRRDTNVLRSRCVQPVTSSDWRDNILVPSTSKSTSTAATTTPTDGSTRGCSDDNTEDPANVVGREHGDQQSPTKPPAQEERKKDTSSTNNKKEVASGSTFSEENEGPRSDDDHHYCELCRSSPCLLEQGLYEELSLANELGLDPDFPFLSNKEIRFRLYKYATNWIHGYLGKDNRVELPQCITQEIRHLAPDSVGFYVGFKKRRVDSNPQEDY
jgi:hypothetical protein